MDYNEFNRRCSKLGIRHSNMEEKIKEFYCVKINNLLKNEAYTWANKHAGNEWIYSSPTHTDWTELYFLKEEDALVFKLTFDTF